jgi:hypothetical protein
MDEVVRPLRAARLDKQAKGSLLEETGNSESETSQLQGNNESASDGASTVESRVNDANEVTKSKNSPKALSSGKLHLQEKSLYETRFITRETNEQLEKQLASPKQNDMLKATYTSSYERRHAGLPAKSLRQCEGSPQVRDPDDEDEMHLTESTHRVFKTSAWIRKDMNSLQGDRYPLYNGETMEQFMSNVTHNTEEDITVIESQPPFQGCAYGESLEHDLSCDPGAVPSVSLSECFDKGSGHAVEENPDCSLTQPNQNSTHDQGSHANLTSFKAVPDTDNMHECNSNQCIPQQLNNSSCKLYSRHQAPTKEDLYCRSHRLFTSKESKESLYDHNGSNSLPKHTIYENTCEIAATSAGLRSKFRSLTGEAFFE